MHNTFYIKDPDLIREFGKTTLYVNDDITTFSGTYTSMADLKAKLTQDFGDEYWYLQTIPISNNLNAETRTTVLSLFKNYKVVSELHEYTYNGQYFKTFPTNIDGGASAMYGPGNNTISIFGQHTQNNYVSFCVWNSSGIAIDETHTSIGTSVKFFNLYVHNGSYALTQFGTPTYGNAISYPISLEYNSDDPYIPGGITNHGGGGGSFDDITDPQTLPPGPTLGVSNVKFIKLWTPTETELINISSFLWSNDFDVNSFKKLFSNPMDCIIGLSIVPVFPAHSLGDTFTIGNVSTNFTVRPITNQYVTKSFGTIQIEEFFGSYLDYSPYTKIELFLPYIGTQEISSDDVMGKTVELQYNIDCLSGACVAMLKCGDNILYQFTGNCAMSIPLVGRDMLSVITAGINVIGKGASAIGGIASSGPLGLSQAISDMTSAVTDVMRAKRNIEKTGNISGSAGFLGVQTPYLIITRPRQALPINQNTFTGYPSFITMTLGNCSGFTTVSSVHLENIPATSTEIAEIENMLATGVFF